MVPIHQPRRDERHVGLGGISEPRASYQVHEITDSSSDCDPHAHKCLFFTLTVQREILEKQKPYNVQPCQYNIYINSSRREQCRKAEQTRAVWAVPAWRLKGKGRKATRKGGGGSPSAVKQREVTRHFPERRSKKSFYPLVACQKLNSFLNLIREKL